MRVGSPPPVEAVEAELGLDIVDVGVQVVLCIDVVERVAPVALENQLGSQLLGRQRRYFIHRSCRLGVPNLSLNQTLRAVWLWIK